MGAAASTVGAGDGTRRAGGPSSAIGRRSAAHATVSQPESARSRRYNRPLTTRPSPRPVAAGRGPRRGARPMTDTATPADRARPPAPPSATSTPGAAGTAEGDATMRDLLGGKGAGLAEMTNAGLPVPPGFTITTEACNDYFAAGEQLPGRPLGRRPRGGQGGRGGRPARASATPPTRSSSASAPGAKFSMPGMMDTVLNLGPQRGDAPRA